MGELYFDVGYEDKIPPDQKEAFKWFSLAAKNGMSVAYPSLGLIYETPEDSNQQPDYQSAALCFSKAARGGDREAADSLIRLYGADKIDDRLNIDFEQILIEGANKSIKDGSHSSFGHALYAAFPFALRDLYEKGNYVPQSYEKAAYWYRQAAKLVDIDYPFV
ncbi:hypothetical protein CI610_00619 [invertebrate metagenome]|uniref:Secretory immunoglobulin A-binding protein EsiB n=1 Tax=invertebrate metagenome TaxID=1711999 RepID=A0A2H9TB14_9ZZZZ